MAMVNPPPAKEGAPRDESWKPDVRIRTAYEKAVTQLAMERFEDARKTIEEVTKAYGDGLKQSLYGQAMPIVEALSYVQEADKKNQEGLRTRGVDILKSLHERPNPWPMVVQWVMSGVLGEAPDVKKAPFQLWIEANDLMAKARENQNAKQMQEAAGLFKAYAEKVGPEDDKYPAALYTRAAALLQVGNKAEAGRLFREVAEKFPEYRYAKAAAGYAVGARGQVYENAKTDENRQAYEDALAWFVKNHLESDPEQAYFYALVLYRGEKYLEAADAFARVPKTATRYPDSRYWVALCRLEHFRNRVLASRDKQLILSGARDVAKRLIDYTKYAFEAQKADLPDEKKQLLLEWAEFAYINAADVYLYQEVSLPADALPILEEMEKRFELTKDMRGRVLKLKIDAYQKLGRLDDARRVLDEFLAVAQPQEVGPVLRGLFAAMTDDVRELIKRGKKELAATKVDQAKTLGSRFLTWLEGSNLPDKQIEIENTRYDLAELYLAVGEHGQALQIYQEIAGPKPEDVKRGEPLPEDAIYGMARAHEGLGDAAASPEEAKPNYERSLELWRVLLDVAEMTPADRWERDYHLLYCKFKLGQKEEVKKAITALDIMKDEPLGGSDPALNKKFRELEAKVAG
jgi:tetratricopeptide (TPR) repeat protein